MSDLERVARLETRTDEQERRLQRIEIKLDQLLEMAAIGKGAGWLLIKAGAALAALGAGFFYVMDLLKH